MGGRQARLEARSARIKTSDSEPLFGFVSGGCGANACMYVFSTPYLNIGPSQLEAKRVGLNRAGSS